MRITIDPAPFDPPPPGGTPVHVVVSDSGTPQETAPTTNAVA